MSFWDRTAAKTLRNRRFTLLAEIDEHEARIHSHETSIGWAREEIASLEAALIKLDEPLDDPDMVELGAGAKITTEPQGLA